MRMFAGVIFFQRHTHTGCEIRGRFSLDEVFSMKTFQLVSIDTRENLFMIGFVGESARTSGEETICAPITSAFERTSFPRRDRKRIRTHFALPVLSPSVGQQLGRKVTENKIVSKIFFFQTLIKTGLSTQTGLKTNFLKSTSHVVSVGQSAKKLIESPNRLKGA